MVAFVAWERVVALDMFSVRGVGAGQMDHGDSDVLAPSTTVGEKD